MSSHRDLGLFGANVADAANRNFHSLTTAKGAWSRIQGDSTHTRHPFSAMAAMPKIAALRHFFEVGERAVLVRPTTDHRLLFATCDEPFEFAMTAGVSSQIDTANREIGLRVRGPPTEKKEADEKKSSCCVHPLRFLVSLGAEIGDAPTRHRKVLDLLLESR